jgi:hypothetical protein
MAKTSKRLMLEFSPIRDAEGSVMDEFKDELNALAEGLAAQHRTKLWSNVGERVPASTQRPGAERSARSSTH